MASKVFISYSDQDPELTKEIAAMLEANGFEVWWDFDLTAGEDFRKTIDKHLDAADAVVVIWTENSIDSKWVIAEAGHADRAGKLIPLRKADLESWRIPKPFGTYHSDVVSDQKAVLQSVQRICHRPEKPLKRPRISTDRRALPWSLAMLAILVSAGGGFLYYQKLQAPKRISDCDGCPNLVEIPGKPAFLLGKTEVTVGQFDMFVRATGYKVEGKCFIRNENTKGKFIEKLTTYREPGFRQSPSHPVACVNWDDAKEYTKWLSKLTGKAYGLPTEARWWFALGSLQKEKRKEQNRICDYANLPDQAAKRVFTKFTAGDCDDGQVFTAPVGTYKPNNYGLHDMLGNLWEWTDTCEDAYNVRKCVALGGSWMSKLKNVRMPNPAKSSLRYNYIGFRVLREK